MVKKIHELEIKIIRRLFLKRIFFLSLYLKFRNVFFSKKIFISPLKSTAAIKIPGIFHELYPSAINRYNLHRVHPTLENLDINVPAIGYYTLKNVMVNPASHLFNYNNTWYHQDVPNINCARWAQAGKHFIENNPDQILFYKFKHEVIEKGIFAGGHWSHNWFHWVWEIVSKIALLQKADIDLKEYVLCLPKRNEHLVNHNDLIDLVGLDLRIIYLDDKINYLIKEACIIDSCVFGSHTLKKGAACKREFQFYVNQAALKDYQNLILKNAGATKLDKKERIFLGRKQQNRMYNQDEVFAFFKSRGFVMVFCEDLSLLQQIELFRNAEMIAGPTGGSWTNMFFSSPDCKAFCWAPDLGETSPVYSVLGLDMGLDIRYGFFEANAEAWRTFKRNGSYKLSQEFLETHTGFMFAS